MINARRKIRLSFGISFTANLTQSTGVPSSYILLSFSLEILFKYKVLFVVIMTHTALGTCLERLLKRRLFLPSRLLRLGPGAETHRRLLLNQRFNVFIFYYF
jgi:hypothetical protein